MGNGVNTLRVIKICNPVRLHEALEAARIPVVTVRADYSVPDDARKNCAMYAVVVVEDSADMAKVQQVVEAHSETQRPSRTPSAEDQERALAQMEKIDSSG